VVDGVVLRHELPQFRPAPAIECPQPLSETLGIATVEAKLADPRMLVEIMVTCAK